MAIGKRWLLERGGHWKEVAVGKRWPLERGGHYKEVAKSQCMGDLSAGTKKVTDVER